MTEQSNGGPAFPHPGLVADMNTQQVYHYPESGMINLAVGDLRRARALINQEAAGDASHGR